MPDTTSIRPLHIRWLKLSHTVHFCAHQAGCDVWIPTCQAADVNPAEVQFGGKTRTKGGALITTSPFYMHMILDALKEGFVTTRSIGSLLISFLITSLSYRPGMLGSVRSNNAPRVRMAELCYPLSYHANACQYSTLLDLQAPTISS